MHPDGIPLHQAKIVKGEIPSDLRGMLCRNGPGRIRVGAKMYGHWFDGDGLVTQLILDGQAQTAMFQAKFVETERFKAQQQMMQSIKTSYGESNPTISFPKAGAWSKRGSGSRLDNIFAIPTNPSNTNVQFLPPRDDDDNGMARLYALAEGGDPVLMNITTLETIGPEKIRSPSSSVTSTSFFSAHYSKDPITQEIYNHGLSLLPPALNIMKLDKNGLLMKQAKTRLPSISFVHDSVLSEHYILAILPPFSVSTGGLVDSLLGGPPLGTQFEWNKKREDTTTAMIFCKESCQCVAEILLPLLSTYHLVDAFDDESVLTFRILEHGPPPSARIKVEAAFADLYRADKIPLCTIVEYTLDLKQKKLKNRKLVAPDALSCELPDTNLYWAGYQKRYCYTNTRQSHARFADSIQRIDMETGECSRVVSFGDGVFAGSPLFVPKLDMKREDDGYVLVNSYDSMHHLTSIYILDASTMEELTRLQLNCHVPYLFHGSWLPSDWV